VRAHGLAEVRAIDRDAELWSLAVAAVKEIQSLSIHREAGQKAARETPETGIPASLAAREKDTLPLELQESTTTITVARSTSRIASISAIASPMARPRGRRWLPSSLAPADGRT
jgi:hypothetical protein